MKFLVLISIIVLSFSSAWSTLCVPGKIDDITLTGTTQVSWVSNPNGCTISEFLIDIIDSEDKCNLAYHVNVTELDTTLELCKEYTFDIRAVTSDHVSGPFNDVKLTTKPSEDDNFGVDFTSISSSAAGVVFTWALEDSSVIRCVTSYKVMYWNEDDSPQNTDVTTPSFSIPNTISCMNYTLMVNAEVNEKGITPESKTAFIRAIPTSAPDEPILSKKVILAESADFIFTVQTYLEYRCNFTLIVEIIGEGMDEKYTYIVPDNAERVRVIDAPVDNLLPDHVYDGKAWTENEAGKSAVLEFEFTTPSS